MDSKIFANQIERLKKLERYYVSVSLSETTTKIKGQSAVYNYLRVVHLQQLLVLNELKNMKIERI